MKCPGGISRNSIQLSRNSGRRLQGRHVTARAWSRRGSADEQIDDLLRELDQLIGNFLGDLVSTHSLRLVQEGLQGIDGGIDLRLFQRLLGGLQFLCHTDKNPARQVERPNLTKEIPYCLCRPVRQDGGVTGPKLDAGRSVVGREEKAAPRNRQIRWGRRHVSWRDVLNKNGPF